MIKLHKSELYFRIDLQISSFLFFFIFFYLGFTARQDYFTNFEPSQTLCGAKIGDRRENPADHPQAELACLSCELGSNPQRSELTSDLER